MPPTFKRQMVAPMTAARSPLEQERRVIDSILASKVGIKDTTLIRYSGSKTTVTYLAQMTSEGNDYLVNLNSFNDIDTNLKVFQRIDDFVFMIKAAIEPEEESDPALGVSEEAQGSAQILPRTIKPRQGDAFVMKQFDRVCLFRVSNVTPKTFENDAGFEINYILEADNFRWDLHPVTACIAENWQFEYRHVGTGMRSLFRKSDYEVLLKLRELYNELSDDYVTRFFNKILNTFLLSPPLDMPETSPFMILEPPKAMEEAPLTNLAQDARDNVQKLVGQKLYDRELVHFINKHSLFTTVDNTLYPTAFLTSRPDVYRDSIFGALEKRTLKRLVLFYQVPNPLMMATPGFPPQLFGKVDLAWTGSLVHGCLDLLPRNFYLKIKTFSYEARSSYDKNFFNNFSDVIVECLSAYLQTTEAQDDSILSRLNFIAINSGNLDNIPDQEKFYLYPLIAKVIIDYMMRLSLEPTNSSFDDSPQGA